MLFMKAPLDVSNRGQAITDPKGQPKTCRYALNNKIYAK
jgi:hypothetical protein